MHKFTLYFNLHMFHNKFTEIYITIVIEIDNDERGVIGDFTTISDIRITKAKDALIVVKSPITPSSELSISILT